MTGTRYALEANLNWQEQKIASLGEGEAWVKSHLEIWRKPGLVLLSGPMGAGKTQVSKWILQSLGADASSPTFSVHHRYTIGGQAIDHFDLYRLKDDSELEGVGFWDALCDVDNLVIVEWADRLPEDSFPASRSQFSLKIETSDKNQAVRIFRWRYP